MVDRLPLRLGDRCFRAAVAPGVGCGPPAPAVPLTAVETRRPCDGLPVESRVPSPTGPPVWSGKPLRRVGVVARLRSAV